MNPSQSKKNPTLSLAIDLNPWETQWRDLIVRSQNGKPDPAHDILHLERVVTAAKRLAREENATLEIVVPAAWFHDWIAVPKNDPRRSQASRLSAEAVLNLLSEMNYPEQYLKPIEHAIEAHSFSANIEPRTLEAKIVQDADRLDALGAIGIARCFSTAGTLGSAFYLKDDPFCSQRTPNDQNFAVDHFYRKLFQLPSTFATNAGRNEAIRRVEFMKEFLKQLEREIV